jgi:hypothetical protein
VYLNREVDYIAADLLDRAGWPSADIDIAATSFVLDEYVVEDGSSYWDNLAKLAGFVAYTLWDDEDGVIHLKPARRSPPASTTRSRRLRVRDRDRMTASPHVMSLGWETDQYDLRTRVKVRGPLTTLKNAWTEVWRTSKFHLPVGLWYDPTDAANLRVLDRGTKRLYKLRQSDRVILSSVYLGGVCAHPLGTVGRSRRAARSTGSSRRRGGRPESRRTTRS